MDSVCSLHGRDEKCIYSVDEITGMCEPLGRSKYRWKGNIEMDLREIRWDYELESSGSG
jgi:hypothetical protein